MDLIFYEDYTNLKRIVAKHEEFFQKLQTKKEDDGHIQAIKN